MFSLMSETMSRDRVGNISSKFRVAYFLALEKVSNLRNDMDNAKATEGTIVMVDLRIPW